MRHLEFDLQLSRTIKVIRELKGMKQINIAHALSMEQSTYSRIEKGEIAITPGQLEIISYELRISTSEILAITNADICLFQDSKFSGRPPQKLTLSKGEIALIFSKLNQLSNKIEKLRNDTQL